MQISTWQWSGTSANNVVPCRVFFFRGGGLLEVLQGKGHLFSCPRVSHSSCYRSRPHWSTQVDQTWEEGLDMMCTCTVDPAHPPPYAAALFCPPHTLFNSPAPSPTPVLDLPALVSLLMSIDTTGKIPAQALHCCQVFYSLLVNTWSKIFLPWLWSSVPCLSPWGKLLHVLPEATGPITLQTSL